MTALVFRTAKGRLTAYALACGYCEQAKVKRWTFTLWHEGACFHVKCYDDIAGRREFWESFDGPRALSDARKFYDKRRKEFKMFKEDLAAFYREYLNDWLTPEAYAEYHSLSLEQTNTLLRIGREIHEELACKSKSTSTK